MSKVIAFYCSPPQRWLPYLPRLIRTTLGDVAQDFTLSKELLKKAYEIGKQLV